MTWDILYYLFLFGGLVFNLVMGFRAFNRYLKSKAQITTMVDENGNVKKYVDDARKDATETTKFPTTGGYQPTKPLAFLGKVKRSDGSRRKSLLRLTLPTPVFK